MKTPLQRGRRALVWGLPAAAVVSLSVGCTSPSSPDDGGQAEASCAYIVEYDNRRYVGRGETVPVAESLGAATRPACDDTPSDGDDGEGPALMTAFALKGVDPSVAIAVAEDTDRYRLVVADDLKGLPPELKKLIDRY
ncbi:DUF6281 family protein [Streptomyces caelestis]|jgi:hypothetical protein|uniref:DUF6281 family protein n=1 Tax=Streptomyces caelestis TaxID=36816 RepID=UPI003700DA19